MRTRGFVEHARHSAPIAPDVLAEPRHCGQTPFHAPLDDWLLPDDNLA